MQFELNLVQTQILAITGSTKKAHTRIEPGVGQY